MKTLHKQLKAKYVESPYYKKRLKKQTVRQVRRVTGQALRRGETDILNLYGVFHGWTN